VCFKGFVRRPGGDSVRIDKRYVLFEIEFCLALRFVYILHK